MRKIHLFLVLVSFFSMQAVFADDETMVSDSKPCAMIASACLKAGYSRQQGGDKRFWMDCMKPLLLGNTVKDVTVDADTVKSCRANKIDQLKKDLNDFSNVSQ